MGREQSAIKGCSRPVADDQRTEPKQPRYPARMMLNANTCVTCSLVDFPAVQESGELMPEVGSLKPLSNSKVTIFSPCNGTVEEGFYRCIFPFAIWYVLRQSTSKNEKRLGIANLSQLMMKLHKFLRSKLWVIRRIFHQKFTVCCGSKTDIHASPANLVFRIQMAGTLGC